MTDERNGDVHIEGVEVPVDHETMFANRLEVLQQMIYEFRFNRGLAEGSEDVGAFAQHIRDGVVLHTVRSSHAGHLVVESHGRSVLIDFSQEEETLEITVDTQTSPLDADAAGIFILTDVQKKLVEADLDSLES